MAGGGLTPLTAAAALLRKHLRFVGKRPVIRDEQTAQLYRSLEERGCLQVVRGKLPVTTVIPVAEKSGFLTRSAPAAELKVNGPFFIMDPFDCATIFDHVGTCFGLSVKDGVVHRPPLYSREALLDTIWAYEYRSDIRTVDVHIRRLREKLEENPAEPKYIMTKWGKGYYFQK